MQSFEESSNLFDELTKSNLEHEHSQLSSDRRSDSGVSTMDSLSSRDHDRCLDICHETDSAPDTLTGILLSEHNNNYAESIDVVKLLSLKSTDKEGQISNSSSLESLNSLDNHQGSQEPEDDGGSGSTSCSEDSFEMSSTCCSTRETPDCSPLRKSDSSGELVPHTTDVASRETSCESATTTKMDVAACSRSMNEKVDRNSSFDPPYFRPSHSMDSFMYTSPKMEAIRESIDQELNSLDTGLPNLDFEKLEHQLTCAKREREDHERKLLGEEVRRRLALQVDCSSGPSPSINTRPHRSNLAMRLQTAMNLQVCYMNELSDNTEDESDSDSDDEFVMSKSKSAPNLKGSTRPGPSKVSPEVLRIRQKAKENRKLDGYERQTLLHAETKRVLQISRTEAQRKVDEHRRTKSRASEVPRQSRHHLSRMKLKDVAKIKETMELAIAKKNLELVQLLMDRDGLHMEHDSLLVDIEDFTEHEAEASALNFPHLLRMQDGEEPPAAVHSNPTAPTFPGHLKSSPRIACIASAPTPSTTPTSPSRSFVGALPNLPNLPTLPKSLSSFFRR